MAQCKARIQDRGQPWFGPRQCRRIAVLGSPFCSLHAGNKRVHAPASTEKAAYDKKLADLEAEVTRLCAELSQLRQGRRGV
jgi:cell division protein FtsB